MVATGSYVAAVAVALLSAADGARIQRRKDGRSFSACGTKGASGPSGQIVNGEAATECEWRWQARLQRNGRPFCGGTLVAPDWVLTAAHCVTKGANFDMVLGGFNTSKASEHQQTRKVTRIISHPGYNTNPTRSDYAMVQLESPVEINECVGVACLPVEGDVPAESTCWITGWGTLKAGGSSPEILQEAPVKTISNDDCVNNFAYARNQIDGSMMCAQGRTNDGRVVDACQGDSGGPLVCESGGKWSVYGATSWGRGCAGETYPGVWARVHEQLDWFQDILNGKDVEPPVSTTPDPMCALCKKPADCSRSYCAPCPYCQNQPTDPPTEPPAPCPAYCFLGCALSACKQCPQCQ